MTPPGHTESGTRPHHMGRPKGTTWRQRIMHPRKHRRVRTSAEEHRTPVSTSPELPRRHARSPPPRERSGPQQGPGTGRTSAQARVRCQHMSRLCSTLPAPVAQTTLNLCVFLCSSRFPTNKQNA
jgi:hypothetical protein